MIASREKANGRKRNGRKPAADRRMSDDQIELEIIPDSSEGTLHNLALRGSEGLELYFRQCPLKAKLTALLLNRACLLNNNVGSRILSALEEELSHPALLEELEETPLNSYLIGVLHGLEVATEPR